MIENLLLKFQSNPFLKPLHESNLKGNLKRDYKKLLKKFHSDTNEQKSQEDKIFYGMFYHLIDDAFKTINNLAEYKEYKNFLTKMDYNYLMSLEVRNTELNSQVWQLNSDLQDAKNEIQSLRVQRNLGVGAAVFGVGSALLGGSGNQEKV